MIECLGSGNDLLSGDDGNDYLSGDEGVDTLDRLVDGMLFAIGNGFGGIKISIFLALDTISPFTRLRVISP
ncbi:hypothetical protein [[Phormidium] sp. ETS-05]|uniref:hypothetical protein n=1 Tax=[Phormidium] sp. ETS-05 TaxID=222819 RepID=UPI0035C90011